MKQKSKKNNNNQCVGMSACNATLTSKMRNEKRTTTTTTTSTEKKKERCAQVNEKNKTLCAAARWIEWCSFITCIYVQEQFFQKKVLTTYSCWCWCCFSFPSICIDPNSECNTAQHSTARGSHFIRFQLYVSSMLSLCWMPTPPPPLPFSCVLFLIRFISHHQHKSASCASLSRDSCTQCLIVIVFQFHLHWCAYVRISMLNIVLCICTCISMLNADSSAKIWAQIERTNERNFDMFAECIKKKTEKTVSNTPSIANIFNLLRIYRFLIS